MERTSSRGSHQRARIWEHDRSIGATAWCYPHTHEQCSAAAPGTATTTTSTTSTITAPSMGSTSTCSHARGRVWRRSALRALSSLMRDMICDPKTWLALMISTLCTISLLFSTTCGYCHIFHLQNQPTALIFYCHGTISRLLNVSYMKRFLCQCNGSSTEW
jgi:hypothetical protein